MWIFNFGMCANYKNCINFRLTKNHIVLGNIVLTQVCGVKIPLNLLIFVFCSIAKIMHKNVYIVDVLRKLFEADDDVRYRRPDLAHVKMEWQPAAPPRGAASFSTGLAGHRFASNTQV